MAQEGLVEFNEQNFESAVLQHDGLTLVDFWSQSCVPCRQLAKVLTQLAEAPLYFRFAGGFFLIVPSLIFIFVVRKYLFSMWGIANK